MPARAIDPDAQVAALTEFVTSLDAGEYAAYATQFDAVDRAILDDLRERGTARIRQEGWRTDPLTMARHLEGDGYADWRFVRYLAGKFRDAVYGVDPNQIWSLPQQLGKSSIVRRGIAWALDADPSLPIILISYADALALESARWVRDYGIEHADQLRYRLRADAKAAGRWLTTEGGGLLATGAGGSVSGFPAGGLVIDDPHKGWIEAHSPVEQNRLWDEYQTVWSARLREGGFRIVLHTRWCEGDLSGRILAAAAQTGERWTHVRLPMIATENDDPIGRMAGDPLEPERYSLDACRARATAMGSYKAAAVEQQDPQPLEGGQIKRHWWKITAAGSMPEKCDEFLSCLPADALVFTENGPRRIVDVRVGDRVWSLDEHQKTMRLARVFQSGQSGVDEVLRIETRSRVLRANAHHRVMVRRKYAAPRTGSGGYKAVEWRNVWVPTDSITVGDYILAAHGMPDGKGDEAPNGRLLSEGFMAFAGLMIGDGSVLKNGLTVACHPDAPYIDTYMRFATEAFTKRGGKPVRWSARVDGRCHRGFSSRTAVQEMNELGFAGHADTKRVPEWVFSLRPNLILAFLRGYLDSDGAVNTRGHITYSSISEALLEDVRHLCMAVGIPTSTVRRYATSGTYEIVGRVCNRRDMHQVFLFSANANRRIGAHHPGKQAHLDGARQSQRGRHVEPTRYRWHPDYEGPGSKGSRPGETFAIEGAVLERVRSITVEPAEPVFDLAVEGTHTFIADGVVVHNSWDMKLKDRADTGDFVVGQVWGRTGSSFWCYDQFRGQWDQATVKAAIALCQVRWPQVRRHIIENTGNGPEVMEQLVAGHRDWIMSDEMAGNLGVTAEERAHVELVMRRGMPGLIPNNPKGNKMIRTIAVSPLIEAGNVHLRDAPFAEDLIGEHAAFPTRGVPDDMVDATSQALAILSGTPGTTSVATAATTALPTRRPGTSVPGRVGQLPRRSRPGPR